jgi:glycosyltransferase involved in cell wall biosynthesis
MNIGFDAKRYFHNPTGLGHYSRTLVNSLASLYPEHTYYLFNPRPSTRFRANGAALQEVLPRAWGDRLFPSLWRSSGVKRDLRRLNIRLYHGLSHEIPLGIARTGIPAVVTMHDLIHERYPGQYKRADVEIYRRKFRYACRHAQRVIAISRQTADDLRHFYQVPDEKIRICYQSCNPSFGRAVAAAEKERVRELYQLPERFFLYVGSIIERKNLLTLCQALPHLPAEARLPLVVIGSGGAYARKVKDWLREHPPPQPVIFLSEHPRAGDPAFATAADFPAIYQQATAMIYPSFFEGFGIPVLEALWSRLPVIKYDCSCLPEAGGEGALYINPASATAIADALTRLVLEPGLAEVMREKGWQHAQRFTPEATARAVMNVYQELW